MDSGEGADFPPSRLQSDTSSTSTSDYPGKKLARQLLFTASCGTSTGPISPEHSQLSPAQAQLQQLPQASGQPQARQPETLMLLSPQASHIPLRAVKPESPVSRGRPNVEVKEGTPKKQKQCNCKHSRCLKLYCECFASGIYCEGCNCVNCYNNVDNDAARREAVEATLERNPQAFRPKIANSPHGKWEKREEVGEAVVLGKHNKGCHCKKSGCLKKYCECFQANILCSDNCKCMDCKNFESSEERQALFHGEHANSFAYIQQAANAAITGAVGSSGYGSPPVSKKRKAHELFFAPTAKDSSIQRLPQFHQTNHVKNSAPPMSTAPVGRVCSNPMVGPSKFTYRSLLADIIQPSYLKELCSVLVVLSGEAAKKLADKNSSMEKKGEQMEDCVGCSSQEQVQRQKDSEGDKGGDDDCTSRRQGEKALSSDDSSSNDAQKGRPMSPGTLALMCDEQDTISAAASPTGFMGHGCTTSSQHPFGQSMPQVYVEQERLVLTKFRDYLNRLITFGEIKEIKCSSSANSETGSQKEQFSNGATDFKFNKPKNQHQPISNGTVHASSFNNSPSKIQSFAENGDVKPKIEEL